MTPPRRGRSDDGREPSQADQVDGVDQVDGADVGSHPTLTERIRLALVRPSIPARRAIVAMLLVCVTYVAVSLYALAVRAPLGHDESVYALRSRDLLEGWTHLSGNYWRDYRAPGLPLMLSGIGRVVGIHVTTARAFVVLLGVIILISTALLGARLRSWSVGVAAAALLAVTYGFVLAASTLLADTPGAAFALIVVVVYAAEVDRGRLRLSFVVVPVATFVSTLSRFGAPFMLGAGLLGVAVISAPDVLRARNRALVLGSAALAVATAAVVALVVLTDLFSLDGTSPATANSRLVGRNEFTLRTGLDDLGKVINPWSGHYFPMFSKPVAVIFLVGVVAAVSSVMTQRSRWRIVVFGLIAGTISLFAVVATVGLVVPNYLMLTVPYWAIVAASGWDWMIRCAVSVGRTRMRSAGRWAIAASVIALGVLAIDVGSDVRRAHRGYENQYQNIRASSVITHDRLGDSCVLISRYTPQAGYYSGCRVAPFEGFGLPDERDALAKSVEEAIELFQLGSPPDAPIAAMLIERAIRQPDLTALGEHPDLFGERLFEAGRPGQFRRHIVVDVVEPCVADQSCPSFSEP